MPTYFAFDERATPDDTDTATCLFAFEAKNDRAALQIARDSIECGFVLFREQEDDLIYSGERRTESAASMEEVD